MLGFNNQAEALVNEAPILKIRALVGNATSHSQRTFSFQLYSAEDLLQGCRSLHKTMMYLIATLGIKNSKAVFNIYSCKYRCIFLYFEMHVQEAKGQNFPIIF
jgi:hypothetical protein